MCGYFSHAPYWGPGPQPRHVPWLGIEPATLWFTGQHSVHWATPPRPCLLSIHLGVKLYVHCVDLWKLYAYSFEGLLDSFPKWLRHFTFPLSPHPHQHLLSTFKKKIVYLFLERGEGKEKEWNINVWLPVVRPPLGAWPTTQACALTGNQTSDPLIHRPALNPLSHTSQG